MKTEKFKKNLEDALLMFFCSVSRNWVSVREKPIRVIFDKYTIPTSFTSSVVKYLASNNYIEVYGEKGAMRYKNGAKVFPVSGDLEEMVEEIIKYDEIRSKESKENKTPSRKRKYKEKEQINNLNKTEKPTVIKDEIKIGDKRYVLHENQIKIVEIVSILTVSVDTLRATIFNVDKLSDILVETNYVTFVHINDKDRMVMDYRKNELFKTPELLTQSMLIKFKKNEKNVEA